MRRNEIIHALARAEHTHNAAEAGRLWQLLRDSGGDFATNYRDYSKAIAVIDRGEPDDESILDDPVATMPEDDDLADDEWSQCSQPPRSAFESPHDFSTFSPSCFR